MNNHLMANTNLGVFDLITYWTGKLTNLGKTLHWMKKVKSYFVERPHVKNLSGKLGANSATDKSVDTHSKLPIKSYKSSYGGVM